MAEKKWAILTNTGFPKGVHENLPLSGPEKEKYDLRQKYGPCMKELFYVDTTIHPGAWAVEGNWWNGPIPKEYAHPTHVHDYDETILFIGTDPEDSTNLGGVVDMYFDGEPAEITKTCQVFIPAGVEHCPLVVKKVDRPFIAVAIANNSHYYKSTPDT